MINRLSPYFSILSWIWLFIVIAFSVYDAEVLFIQKKVQFDIMALLPESKTETMKAASHLMKEAGFTNRVLIFVGHPDAATSQASFEKLRQEIKRHELPLKEQTTKSVAEDYKSFFKALYPYRAGLLAENDRDLLLKGKGDILAQSALSKMMMPFSLFGPLQLKSDPFSLLF